MTLLFLPGTCLDTRAATSPDPSGVCITLPSVNKLERYARKDKQFMWPGISYLLCFQNIKKGEGPEKNVSGESYSHGTEMCLWFAKRLAQNKRIPSYFMKNRNIPQFTPTVSRVIILTALCWGLSVSHCAKCLKDSPLQGLSQCFSGWDSTLPRQGAQVWPLVREPDPACPN